MNTTQDNILNKILDDLKAAQVAATPVSHQEDREPGPFTFSDKKDKEGLLYESKHYVDRNCNDCYGRGFQVYLIGDGYFPGRVARKARDVRACRCVIKGYVRARLHHEKSKKTSPQAA